MIGQSINSDTQGEKVQRYLKNFQRQFPYLRSHIKMSPMPDIQTPSTLLAHAMTLLSPVLQGSTGALLLLFRMFGFVHQVEYAIHNGTLRTTRL